MPDSVTNMSVEEYVAHRGLQVVHFDTDLQDFQFELESVEWDGGRPNDDQIIEVTWASLVPSPVSSSWCRGAIGKWYETVRTRPLWHIW